MAKSERSKPRPEEQVELRAKLEQLHPALLGKAILLSRGLPPPRPEPAELVSETLRRLLARYADSQVNSASGLAFTTLQHIVFDIARKGRAFGGFIEDDGEVADPVRHEPEPFVRRALERLSDLERCVVIRAGIEGTAVPEAFELCGWRTRSPYAEYKKILDRLKTELEESHE
jgi:DNA-directed RNA polymerase specialized sigma24 family protein